MHISVLLLCVCGVEFEEMAQKISTVFGSMSPLVLVVVGNLESCAVALARSLGSGHSLDLSLGLWRHHG